MSYSALDIAHKIVIHQTDLEKGETVTNLKLQKLLYYVQGFHLAFFDTPLFEENLEAWAYGPVVPEIYRTFKDNGRMAIDIQPDAVKIVSLEEEQEEMFSQVMHEYGKFSAIRLMEMTHLEKPWVDAYNADNKTINLETMKEYFRTKIDG